MLLYGEFLCKVYFEVPGTKFVSFITIPNPICHYLAPFTTSISKQYSHYSYFSRLFSIRVYQTPGVWNSGKMKRDSIQFVAKCHRKYRKLAASILI